MDSKGAMPIILCVFKRNVWEVIFVVYVDDIVVTYNDGDEINNLKAYMTAKSKIILDLLNAFLALKS